MVFICNMPFTQAAEAQAAGLGRGRGAEGQRRRGCSCGRGGAEDVESRHGCGSRGGRAKGRGRSAAAHESASAPQEVCTLGGRTQRHWVSQPLARRTGCRLPGWRRWALPCRRMRRRRLGRGRAPLRRLRASPSAGLRCRTGTPPRGLRSLPAQRAAPRRTECWPPWRRRGPAGPLGGRERRETLGALTARAPRTSRRTRGGSEAEGAGGGGRSGRPEGGGRAEGAGLRRRTKAP